MLFQSLPSTGCEFPISIPVPHSTAPSIASILQNLLNQLYLRPITIKSHTSDVKIHLYG